MLKSILSNPMLVTASNNCEDASAIAFIGTYSNPTEDSVDQTRLYPLGAKVTNSMFRPCRTYQGLGDNSELSEYNFVSVGPYYNHVPESPSDPSEYTDSDCQRPSDEAIFYSSKYEFRCIVRLSFNNDISSTGIFNVSQIETKIENMYNYLKTSIPPIEGNTTKTMFEYIDNWWITPDERSNTSILTSDTIANNFNSFYTTVKNKLTALATAYGDENIPITTSEAMGKSYNASRAAIVHTSIDIENPQNYRQDMRGEKQSINFLEALWDTNVYFGKKPMVVLLDGFSAPHYWDSTTLYPEYIDDKENYTKVLLYYQVYITYTWDYLEDSFHNTNSDWDFNIIGTNLYTADRNDVNQGLVGTYFYEADASTYKINTYKQIIKEMRDFQLDKAFLWGTKMSDLSLNILEGPRVDGDYAVYTESDSGTTLYKYDLITWKNIKYKDYRYIVVVCNEQLKKPIVNGLNDYTMVPGEDISLEITGFPTDTSCLTYVDILDPVNTGIIENGKISIYFKPSDLTYSRVKAFRIERKGIPRVPLVHDQDQDTGLVTFYANEFSNNTSQSDTHSWVSITDNGMEAVPNDNNNCSLPNCTRLEYTINFSKTGTHYVWVHGRSKPGDPEPGKSDSVYVGLNSVDSTDSISSFGSSGVYTWSNTSFYDGNPHTITVPSTGEHTLYVSMREDGFSFNEIHISNNSNYDPEAVVIEPGDSIRPYINNPRYWQYKGEPILLRGWSVTDTLIDGRFPSTFDTLFSNMTPPYPSYPNTSAGWTSAIDTDLENLATNGGNYLRLTLADFSAQDSSVNPIYPYALSNGIYDLNTRNPEWWRRLEYIFSKAQSLDIIVQVELWDPWALRDKSSTENRFWADSFWAPDKNNAYTNSTGLTDVWAYSADDISNLNPFYSAPTTTSMSLVYNKQKIYIDSILEVASAYNNIIFQIANESFEPVNSWTKIWADRIQNSTYFTDNVYSTDSRNLHCIDSDWNSIINNPTSFNYLDISQLSSRAKGDVQFNVLTSFSSSLSGANIRPINTTKIYSKWYASVSGCANQGGDNSISSDYAIMRFWIAYFSGLAAVRFHRPITSNGNIVGIGQAEALRHVKAAEWLESKVNLWDMTPILLSTNPFGNSRITDSSYAMKDISGNYIAFITKEADTNTTIRVTDTNYNLIRYDIDANTESDLGYVTTSNSYITLTKPSATKVYLFILYKRIIPTELPNIELTNPSSAEGRISINTGDTIDFTAVDATTYSWDFDGGDPTSGNTKTVNGVQFNDVGLNTVTLTTTGNAPQYSSFDSLEVNVSDLDTSTCLTGTISSGFLKTYINSAREALSPNKLYPIGQKMCISAYNLTGASNITTVYNHGFTAIGPFENPSPCADIPGYNSSYGTSGCNAYLKVTYDTAKSLGMRALQAHTMRYTDSSGNSINANNALVVCRAIHAGETTKEELLETFKINWDNKFNLAYFSEITDIYLITPEESWAKVLAGTCTLSEISWLLNGVADYVRLKDTLTPKRIRLATDIVDYFSSSRESSLVSLYGNIQMPGGQNYLERVPYPNGPMAHIDFTINRWKGVFDALNNASPLGGKRIFTILPGMLYNPPTAFFNREWCEKFAKYYIVSAFVNDVTAILLYRYPLANTADPWLRDGYYNIIKILTDHGFDQGFLWGTETNSPSGNQIVVNKTSSNVPDNFTYATLSSGGTYSTQTMKYKQTHLGNCRFLAITNCHHTDSINVNISGWNSGDLNNIKIKDCVTGVSTVITTLTLSRTIPAENFLLYKIEQV